MKTQMRIAAMMIAGSLILGCDNKAKEQQDAAAQPSRTPAGTPAMPTVPADTSTKATDATNKAGDMMKSAGDTIKQDTAKATAAAKQDLNNAGNALKQDAQKLKDKANGTPAPPQ